MATEGNILEPIVQGEILKLRKDKFPHLKEKSWRLVRIEKGTFLLRDCTEKNNFEARPEDINWEEYRNRRRF